jgi:hypothetical protein
MKYHIPMNAWSDEDRAVLSASMKLRHAKQRAAIYRGEAKRFPQGRKKKWLIPRPWRFKLSEADETRVLAAMVLHDIRVRGGEPRPPWQGITSRSDEANALGSLERSLMIRLNDRDRPLAKDEMERLYALVRTAEQALGLPGADVRLKRLEWEVDRFRLRCMTDAAIDRAAKPAPASHDVERADRLPEPATQVPDDFRDSICPPCPVETEQDRVAKRWQRALDLAETIKRAGQIAGTRLAGVPYEVDFQGRRVPPRPHNAAPWLVSAVTDARVFRR